MKRILVLGLGFMLAGCGNTSLDNEVIGQAKKVMNNTNLVCFDYKILDVSLGVVRGGTGSMSKEDLLLVVTNKQDLSTIKKAVETGALVKVRYNVRRWSPCSENHWMTSIEIVQ